jgi:hypothetical protein
MKHATLTLAGLLALCLAVPAGFGAEPPASKPPAVAPAPAATLRERIDHDYLMQFLVYQRREIASGKIPLLTTDADAVGAVDGIKDGKAGFHTNPEASPWWQVDLGDQGPIAKVRIYNREDYPPGIPLCSRLVISTSADGKTWTQQYQHDGRVVGGAAKNDPLEVTFATPVRGRFLRIHLPQDGTKQVFLHLAEVEVFGPADPARNLALRRPANQSSLSRWSVSKLPPTPLQQWVKEFGGIGGHMAYPLMEPTHLEPALLKEYGAACAARGLAQVDVLGKRGKDLTGDRAKITAAAAALTALAEDSPSTSLRAAYLALRWAIRPVVFRHPAWDVKDLLFYTRRDGMGFPDVSSIHMPWVGSPGGDLMVLTPAGPQATESNVRPLLKGRLAPGHVRGLDLHWDGTRVLFGWTHGAEDFSKDVCRPGHDSFKKMGSGWIYELDLASNEVRQITRGNGVHDAAPCYLHEDRLAFMSNRSRSSVQCNQGNHEMFANIYACRRDGSGLERLNNNITGDYLPRLLDDGRIGYLRWEYNERSFNNPHAFWTMRPDGTYAEPVFGQHLGDPIMHVCPRNIPGTSSFMMVVSQHYNYERGILGVLDPNRGPRDPKAVVPLLPQTAWNPNTGHPSQSSHGWYADPWPLAADLALCSFDTSPNQYEAKGFGLYLVDGSGNQELLWRDPDFSCHQPVPLRSRPAPVALPRQCDPPPAEPPPLSPVGFRLSGAEGRCELIDVTYGLDPLPAGVKPAWLRVSENLPLPYFTQAGQSTYFNNLGGVNWTPKRIVGDVPIRPDGGVSFTVPADKALYFQLLDEQGREIRRMRSWVSLKTGERRGCVGCHEGRPEAPRRQAVLATSVPAAIKPQVRVSWGQKPVSYLRDIEPIVQRHCVGCHSGLKPAKNLDLRGLAAANALTPLCAIGHKDSNAEISKTLQFGSGKAPLIASLRDPKHPKHTAVRLTDQEWIDLMAWVDLSAPIYDRCIVSCGFLYGSTHRYTPEGDIVGYEDTPPGLAKGHPGQPDQARPSPMVQGVSLSIPKAVQEIAASRCVSCHAKPQDILRPHWIDVHDPARSLILTAPSTGPCTGQPLAKDDDPDRKAMLDALRQTVAECWRKPDIAMLPLVEAGRTPAWVGQMPVPTKP